MKLYNQLTTIIRRLTEAQTDALMSDGTAYPQFVAKTMVSIDTKALQDLERFFEELAIHSLDDFIF